MSPIEALILSLIAAGLIGAVVGIIAGLYINRWPR